MRRRLVPALALLITTVAACGDAASTAELSLVRDSAGIRIADNVFPDSTMIVWWTLAPEPLLDIGGVDAEDEYALFQVGSVRRMEDGRIIVAHGGGHDVRIYDADGGHLRSIGREGDGPGEFRRPARVYVVDGDSLLVYDSQARRLTVLAPDGTYARDWPLQQPDGRPAALVGVFADGSMIAQGNTLFGSEGPPPSGRMRPDVAFLRIAPGASTVDTLAVVAGAESFLRTNSDASGRITSMEISRLPFGRTAAAAVGPEELLIGTQDTPELRYYSPTGVLRKILRTGAPMTAVTPAHLEAWAERQMENMPPERHPEFRTRFADMPHGETVPPYEMVMFDEAGNTWVQDFDDRVSPAGGWSVYDPSGRIIARIRMPAAVRPHHIGPDFVLGVETDELDVEHVRMYRLERVAG